MFVTIRLFARLREIAGAAEIRRELPDDATAQTAWAVLAREFPELAAHERSVSCAVNEDYARLFTPLHDGDEVAFLPPVSGG
jgi:molybdopterin converting factor subunit 1